MVFKKPFAFIIKHFKAFHMVMLLSSIFIMFNFNQIRELATSLIKANAYMYSGAKTYTSSPVIYVALIGLVAVAMVYWLFKTRKKDLRYYTYVLAYYIGSIVAFMYLFKGLNAMVDEDVTIDTLNALRDISLIFTMASLPVVIMSFVRALGFNIKQFNFSKDIKELEITDKDSEEFEVLIGQNNYKYVRKVRKICREIRYVILENLFYIGVVSAGIIVVGGISVGSVIYKNSHTIRQSEVTTVNGVYYVVNGTYITARDMNGNQLKEGYKYVIVDLAMQNVDPYNKKFINYELYTLQTGRLIYKPIMYFQNKFQELGKHLEKDTEIPRDKFINGLLVFEIPESMNVTRFNFRVLEGYTTTEEDFIVNHVNFAANGKELDLEQKEIDLEVGQRINTNVIDGSIFNIVITDYKLRDSYDEKYVICKSELECKPTSTLVRPEAVNAKTMVVLSYEGVLDSEASYYTVLNTMESFVNAYTRIEYMIGNKMYSDEAKVLPRDVNGKLFLEVNRDISKANSINLIFTFRNESFIMALK